VEKNPLQETIKLLLNRICPPKYPLMNFSGKEGEKKVQVKEIILVP
jgi:hypothetical protein